MKSRVLIAVEKSIQMLESKIKMLQKQLQDHESGENKLSKLMKVSTETQLEKAYIDLEDKKNKLKQLQEQDQRELEEKAKLEEMMKRQAYLDKQPDRIEKNKEINEAVRFEAISLLEELPKDIWFEDEELIDIATEILKLNIRNLEDIFDKYQEVRKRFDELVQKLPDDKPKELELLSIRIPIIIVHFWTLRESIEETLKKQDENVVFKGFLAYEDWWVSELWINHQAYFSLYIWKETIANKICITKEQRDSWYRLFNNWVFTKKLLNLKGKIAFEYEYIFDSLLKEYAILDEEIDPKKLKFMENIMIKLSQKEDIFRFEHHNIITPYMKFKLEKEKKK